MHYDYSDADDFGRVAVLAYSLEEMAAEKLRGLLFQRVNPSPRDAYDLWYPWTEEQVDWTTVVHIFPRKCTARGISVASLSAAALAEGEAGLHSVWESTLRGLTGTYPPLDEAWAVVEELVSRLSRGGET